MIEQNDSPTRAADPSPEVLGAYVRSWETGDLESLVALLRKDVVFAMPPHATWFRGADAVRAFLQTPRFAEGLRPSRHPAPLISTAQFRPPGGSGRV